MVRHFRLNLCVGRFILSLCRLPHFGAGSASEENTFKADRFEVNDRLETPVPSFGFPLFHGLFPNHLLLQLGRFPSGSVRLPHLPLCPSGGQLLGKVERHQGIGRDDFFRVAFRVRAEVFVCESLGCRGWRVDVLRENVDEGSGGEGCKRGEVESRLDGDGVGGVEH